MRDVLVELWEQTLDWSEWISDWRIKMEISSVEYRATVAIGREWKYSIER